MIDNAADEICRKKGHAAAEKFRDELLNKVLVGQLTFIGGVLAGGAGGSVLGPIGSLGGMIFGGYKAYKNTQAKIENLRYKYLYGDA